MAFDDDLANRIPELLGTERGVQEMSMFGGPAFSSANTWLWQQAPTA